jgi:hypothetical protein
MWDRNPDSFLGFTGSLYMARFASGICHLTSTHGGNFGQTCDIGDSPPGITTYYEFDPDQTTYQQTRYLFQYTYQNGGLVYKVSLTPTPIPDPPPVDNNYFPPRVWSYSGVRVKIESELVFT